MTELEKVIQEREKKNGFMRHNFIEMESVERDRAVFKLTIRPESKNPYGMIHGGAIYTLADNSTGKGRPARVMKFILPDSLPDVDGTPL